MKRRKQIIQIFYGVLFLCVVFWFLHRTAHSNYNQIEGKIFGTTYYINIPHGVVNGVKAEIETRLDELNNTFSTYNPASLTYRLNEGEDLPLNDDFIAVFNLSQQISQTTNGAFDITAAPLVNAYGFGHTRRTFIDSGTIDSILPHIGYEKVSIENNKLVKKHEAIELDFAAVAKGYAVDAVATILDNADINDYLVEIGGEVKVKGKNKKGKNWTIGIDEPSIKNKGGSTSLFSTIKLLGNKAVATSGNYRNYYEVNGEIFSHTINPKNGTIARNRMLSTTIVANSCAEADAYATAFMVLGVNETKRLLKELPIDGYLIFKDSTHSSSLKYFKTLRIDEHPIKRLENQ